MFYLKLLFYVCFVSFVASEPRKYTLSDEIYYKSPKLFSLDEYDRCFSEPNGVYCMGIFALRSDQENHVYDGLKNHSQFDYHFNYTKLHRGVCVSATCPDYNSSNVTHNFANCVSDMVTEKYGFQADLETLHYCKSSEQYRNGLPVDIWDKIFLYIFYMFVAMNILGTLYDTHTRGNENRNNYILAWSFRHNIYKLFEDSSGPDPRINDLACSYGGRMVALLLVLFCHLVWTNYALYLQEPRLLEDLGNKPAAVILQNGPIVIQWFVMLSTLLLTYNILISSETHQNISIKMLPLVIMSRLIRIVPLYYLTLGFSATWWKHVGSGPLWPYLAEKETEICRESMWKNVLLINNLGIGDPICIVQTWFLATDLHIHIVASILVLTMWTLKSRDVYKTFISLFVLASVGTSLLSYYLDMKPPLLLNKVEYLRVFAKGLRDTFLYFLPTSSLAASFAGILGAWIIYDCQKYNYDLSKNKLFMAAFTCSVPLCFLWIQSGFWVKRYVDTRLSAAIYAGIDKPVFILLLMPLVVGCALRVHEGIWQFFSWRGWYPLSRSSLAVMLIHWHFHIYLVANQSLLREVTWTLLIVEFIGSVICIFAIAVVLTATFEYPVKNSLKLFMLSRVKVKTS